MMGAYFNEFDRHAAAWLEGLSAAGHLPAGTVDRRDIREVRPDDVRGFDECHFFAGIGGWPLALRLGGWPAGREVWTGSCPCQPFSAAGKRKGDRDDRHLWPEFFRLIRECRPRCILGEQVAGAIGFGWLDGISADLEGEGYAIGAAVLGAHSVGAPHIRQRLFWVADSHGPERRRRPAGRGVRQGELLHTPDRSGPRGVEHPASHGRVEGRAEPVGGGTPGGRGPGGVGDPDSPREGPLGGVPSRARAEREGGPAVPLADSVGQGLEVDGQQQARGERPPTERGGATGGLGDAGCDGWEQGPAGPSRPESDPGRAKPGYWSAFDLIPCRDGRARRVEPGTFPLVARLPGRVGLLRGYGNSIVPQVAAEFVAAFLETA